MGTLGLPDSVHQASMMIVTLIVMIVTLLYSSCLVSAGSINRADHYLTKYGYLDNNKDRNQGLEAFQTLSGLAVTGNIDPATESQMLVPRCGARDDRGSVEIQGDQVSRVFTDV